MHTQAGKKVPKVSRSQNSSEVTRRLKLHSKIKFLLVSRKWAAGLRKVLLFVPLSKVLAEAKSYEMQGIYMWDIMSASVREH